MIFSRSIVLLLAIAASLTAIDTFPAWNGTQFISSFGITNTATYGQTITVTGTEGNLTSLSFQIGNCNNPVSFRAYVYAWDGDSASGTQLFRSGVFSVPAGATFNQVNVSIGALPLSPGVYVVFVSTSEDQSGGASACRFGSVPAASYTGGDFVFLNNGAAPGLWTSAAWSTFTTLDLAFQANFDGLPLVPIPGTLPLLMIGLPAIGLFGRYARKRMKSV